MPSSRSSRRARAATAAHATAAAVLLALSALSALSACGDDTDVQCGPSFLRYDNFGSPFIVNWCRSCHSVDLPPDMRQDAPDDINFDTLDEIRAWSFQIKLTTGEGDTMPPAGGPSANERAMLVEWLRCGAP
jgi:uncharacterized membrane protein